MFTYIFRPQVTQQSLEELGRTTTEQFMDMLNNGANPEKRDVIIGKLAAIETYHNTVKNELDHANFASVINICQLVMQWKAVLLAKDKFDGFRKTIERANLLNELAHGMKTLQSQRTAENGKKFVPLRKLFQVALEVANRVSFKLSGKNIVAKKSGILFRNPNKPDKATLQNVHFIFTENGDEYDLMRYIAVHFKNEGILKDMHDSLKFASELYTKIISSNPFALINELRGLPEALASLNSTLSKELETADPDAKLEIERLMSDIGPLEVNAKVIVESSDEVKAELIKFKDIIPCEKPAKDTAAENAKKTSSTGDSPPVEDKKDEYAEFTLIRDNLKTVLASFQQITHERPIGVLKSAVFKFLDTVTVVDDVKVAFRDANIFTDLSIVDQFYEDRNKAFDEHIALVETMTRSEFRIALPGLLSKVDDIVKAVKDSTSVEAKKNLPAVLTVIKYYLTSISDMSYLPEEDDEKDKWIKPSVLQNVTKMGQSSGALPVLPLSLSGALPGGLTGSTRTSLVRSLANGSPQNDLITNLSSRRSLARIGLNFQFNFANQVSDLKETIWRDVDRDEHDDPTVLNESLLRRKFFDEPAEKRLAAALPQTTKSFFGPVIPTVYLLPSPPNNSKDSDKTPKSKSETGNYNMRGLVKDLSTRYPTLFIYTSRLYHFQKAVALLRSHFPQVSEDIPKEVFKSIINADQAVYAEYRLHLNTLTIKENKTSGEVKELSHLVSSKPRLQPMDALDALVKEYRLSLLDFPSNEIKEFKKIGLMFDLVELYRIYINFHFRALKPIEYVMNEELDQFEDDPALLLLLLGLAPTAADFDHAAMVYAGFDKKVSMLCDYDIQVERMLNDECFLSGAINAIMTNIADGSPNGIIDILKDNIKLANLTVSVLKKMLTADFKDEMKQFALFTEAIGKIERTKFSPNVLGKLIKRAGGALGAPNFSLFTDILNTSDIVNKDRTSNTFSFIHSNYPYMDDLVDAFKSIATNEQIETILGFDMKQFGDAIDAADRTIESANQLVKLVSGEYVYLKTELTNSRIKPFEKFAKDAKSTLTTFMTTWKTFTGTLSIKFPTTFKSWKDDEVPASLQPYKAQFDDGYKTNLFTGLQDLLRELA